MSVTGHITLRDRVFKVKQASVKHREDLWSIEIETHAEEFDGERWAPCLYHQGLRLHAHVAAELPGESTSWGKPGDADYPHPEFGVMYVFGHEVVRHCKLTFGPLVASEIEVTWEGECDVFWEGEYFEDVPFRCKCTAVANAG